MLKKKFDKLKQCFVERRLPSQARIDRFIRRMRMRFETWVFNLNGAAALHKTDQTKKKYLFAAAVGGEGKSTIIKLIEKFGYRDFDYIFFVWDETRLDEPVFGPCKVIYEKGIKWFFFKKYLPPEICKNYHYLFLWDDDLDCGEFDYQDFIAILRRNKLQMAQPALTLDSCYSHKITLKRPGRVGRFVDFIEIMAPVFDTQAWTRFWEMMEPEGNSWGYGYDNLARSVCGYHNMGIVDRQAVRHMRSCRKNVVAGLEGKIFVSKFPACFLAQHLEYGSLRRPS